MEDKRYKKLIKNVNKLSTFDLRTLNRYYLHSEDKRCCSKCKIIFYGIKENFHIKKCQSNKRISYNVNCKQCFNSSSKERRLKYRKDYKLFIKSKLSSYKNRAKELGVNFDLDADYLIDLFEKQNQKCFYTHVDISFENTAVKNTHPHNLTPSLDRLNPNLGYVNNNVVWTAYYINRMKNELNYNDFVNTCKIISEIHNG